MSEGDEVPVKPILEKIKGFCPHCKLDIYWERINKQEVDYKYKRLLYLKSKIDKISQEVHGAMYRIEKIFKETSDKFSDLKIILELDEFDEPVR